jgi:chromosome segregation ATPase
MQGLQTNPTAQKAVNEYETAAKSVGESLPLDQRSYPAIVAHLAAELRSRDQQLADLEATVKTLREERDRFRQDAEEYQTRRRGLEKTLEESPKP